MTVPTHRRPVRHPSTRGESLAEALVLEKLHAKGLHPTYDDLLIIEVRPENLFLEESGGNGANQLLPVSVAFGPCYISKAIRPDYAFALPSGRYLCVYLNEIHVHKNPTKDEQARRFIEYAGSTYLAIPYKAPLSDTLAKGIADQIEHAYREALASAVFRPIAVNRRIFT